MMRFCYEGLFQGHALDEDEGAVTVIDSWLGHFLDGGDRLIIVLVIFGILDYVTGLMRTKNPLLIAARTDPQALCFPGQNPRA